MYVDETNGVADKKELEDHQARYEVGDDFGAENILMPQVEYNMTNYIWIGATFFHLIMICLYVAGTFGNHFGLFNENEPNLWDGELKHKKPNALQNLAKSVLNTLDVLEEKMKIPNIRGPSKTPTTS